MLFEFYRKKLILCFIGCTIGALKDVGRWEKTVAVILSNNS